MPALTARPTPSGHFEPRVRAANEVPQIDPRDHDPNANPAIGTVGPDSSDGFGNTHVMYPTGGWHAEAWSGWPVDWQAPWFGEDWSGFGYGRQNDAGYWGRVSTVAVCVDLNTRQLASFPIYGLRDGVQRRLPSWSVNPEPTIYAGWSDFMRALANSLQLSGEAILYATGFDFAGYPSRFVVLNPTMIEVEPDGAGGTMISVGGDRLAASEVLQIRYQTLAGRARGVSPIEWVGRNLVSAAALERYATDIATHGVWAVIRHPGNLSAKQRDDLKANWMLARAEGGSAPAVLSGGIELETLQMSPRDMALLDLRVFDEQRICAAFGVPPFLVGLPQAEGLTYANATSLFDFHWRATLRPMASFISEALSSWLLPRGWRIEFNRDEYVRPALGERATAYATLHGIEDATGRVLNADEIRQTERFAGSMVPEGVDA